MRNCRFLKNFFFRREDGAEEAVTIPHDWAIGGPFDQANDLQVNRILQNGEEKECVHSGRTGGLPHVGKGRYRCTIPGPSAPGKQVSLLFDGVMSHAKVYLNGQLAGSCNYGYSSFRVEATEFLHKGENLLEVTAENFPSASRWYPGAGIYRPVRLIETDPVRFGNWAAHLHFIPGENLLHVETFIENLTGKAVEGELVLASPLFETKTFPVRIPAGGLAFDEKRPLLPCERWSPDSPRLYDVKLEVKTKEYDDAETIPFGVREIRFDKDRGFFLNGQRVKLNGVCMHHDQGPLGAAFHPAAARRQLAILKEMGCNAIRTSHNPPAPLLLDLCDEMGFLVMDEAFDCWHTGKTANDYSRHFDEDSEKDLSSMVRRDRNHPCVILWSIGNELMEIFDPALRGDLIANRLVSIVKKHDANRPVTAGLNACEKAIAAGIADRLDIPAWNYHPHSYAKFHRRFPRVPVIGSETLSTLSSRGIYYFPAKEHIYDTHPRRKETPERQCSSYCLDVPPWANTPETELSAQDAHEFVAGQFIWTGFDYLGEPYPYDPVWPARSSYFGCVDLVGIPKDLFYIMQARWKKEGPPMLHLIPHHWNWEEGLTFDVHAASNCDEAELFLNGKSLGRTAPHPDSDVPAERYRFVWHDVPWEPGTLRAVGYRKGLPCAEETLRTAAKPAKLHLETARAVCAADGEDMLFVTVSVLDEKGTLCAKETPFVKFSPEGVALKLLAADAGDPTSLEPFPTPQCKLFSGMGAVYLQSTGKEGECLLRAESPGLESAELRLTAEKAVEA